MNIQWCWYRFEELSGLQMHTVLKLRQQVFVVEQKCAYLDADDLDTSSWHLLGTIGNGKLVAYARLNFPESRYIEPSFGRVVTSSSARGLGIGKELVQACIHKSRQEYPDSSIRISAQSYLIDFYLSFGFKTVGDLYDEDGIEHVDMVLEN